MIPLSQLSVISGRPVPVLGQGTWFMGESGYYKQQEIKTLRAGIERGLTLIDTAEMYANGEAEKIVAEAIVGQRDDTFIVSKVLPNHASYHGTLEACENSLRRLQSDFIDLYLLHWRGNLQLTETLHAMKKLRDQGKIRYFGVSNFDIDDLTEISEYLTEQNLATNQVLYNLKRRGIEFDVLPWCQQRKIPIMAYSPLEQGRLLKNEILNKIAMRHEASTAQIALNWLLQQPDVISIPKMAKIQHLEENYQAISIQLTPEDYDELNTAFPPPTQKVPLQTL